MDTVLTGYVNETVYEPTAPSPAPVSYNPIYWPPPAVSNNAPPPTYNGPDLNSPPDYAQASPPGGFDFSSVLNPQSPATSVYPTNPTTPTQSNHEPALPSGNPQGVQELSAPPPGALNKSNWLLWALLALGVGTAIYLMGKPSKPQKAAGHKHSHHNEHSHHSHHSHSEPGKAEAGHKPHASAPKKVKVTNHPHSGKVGE